MTKNKFFGLKLKPTLAITCLLAALGAQPGQVRAEDDAPEPPPAPRAAPVAPADLVEQSALQAKIAAQMAKHSKELEDRVGPLVQQAQRMTWDFNFNRSAQNRQSLIIRTTETDSNTLAASGEDLKIMRRILDRAAGESQKQEAMGIKVSLWGSGGARNLELEGYGAVFLMNVDFPLAGPEVKSDDETAGQSANSAWDEAKNEVEGTQSKRLSHSAGFHYNPERVEKLKASLLEALKNATNIRNLKADESVTVVVTGMVPEPAPDMMVQKIDAELAAANAELAAVDGLSGKRKEKNKSLKEFEYRNQVNDSTLTIRAHKSDIDQFAQGKITRAEFQQKVSMSVY